MNKLRVLLADDEPVLVMLIGNRIQGWGYELVTASTASRTIEIVRDGLVDIIVLDYSLPDQDGIKTLQQIRDINPNIPVIMFTAYPGISLIQQAEELGISAFIPKTSIANDVTAALNTALSMVSNKLNPPQTT